MGYQTMKEKFRAGSSEWFMVHMITFFAIMVMIVLSYPIFGVFTDDQISWACVIWCALWFVEGIFGLKGWEQDETTRD